MERDPAHAAAEYLAEFRSDIETFIKLDEVERCVSHGIDARPPLGGCRYRAFVDPSGGSNDSFTLAIAHKEDRLIVLDRVVERKPPFSPASVVEEFAAILKLYRVNKSTVIATRVNGRANNFARLASATSSRPNRRATSTSPSCRC